MINKALYTSNKDDWETPKHIFKLAEELYGEFTLDACANSYNTLCSKYYDKEKNSLIQPWEGNVWCNPPYGRDIINWVKKAYKVTEEDEENKATVCMLLPARTDTKWFHDYVYKASEITFLKGRLHFSNSKNAAPFPSMLAYFKYRGMYI